MNLQHIVDLFVKKQALIEKFFSEKSENLIPPLYLSCDVRHSGYKMGVIDTNLYPAGFNNLCNAYSKEAAQAFQRYFQRYYPDVKRVILLSEEHTRNRYYLENIFKLKQTFESIGLEVKVAYLGQEIMESKITVFLDDENELDLYRLEVEGKQAKVQDFIADHVISNCDFSMGIPEYIEPILDQIIPSPQLGWHRRRKSRHFQILSDITREFSESLDIDPWILSSYFKEMDDIAPDQANYLETLAQGTQQVLDDVAHKYQEYGVSESPYVFIKNDSGTYGMGIIDVSSAEEVRQLNRKSRNKLFSAKGGNKPRSFLIQEGIPTVDYYSSFPIEPVIYLVGFDPIGGFFRMNTEQNSYSSLNSRGMIFSCLCLHKIDEPHESNFLSCQEKQSLVFLSKVLAKLAALAAALESEEIKREIQAN